MRNTGFPPLVAGSPRVLILGSMPGKESLRQNQYYAHPRNLFWEIMGQLFQFQHTIPYEERVTRVLDQRIAIWDVIEQCRRQGSLDSSIESASIKVNDFRSLFADFPSIRFVFFNGRKAEMEYRKNVLDGLQDESDAIRYETLPSTSPANASITREVKFRQWARIKSCLHSAGDE